tara:strand:- start:1566 stop:2243 length:678 start_codon:yes stop_codon:yes gene_type:complete
MKNLIFCSAAFHVKQYPYNIRENEYYYCLKQLLKMIPENFDIVVCDNTIKSIENLENKNLKEILSKVKFLILNRNIGENNIGMGELDELIYTSENINFNDYNKIVYFTLRKIVTNPWIFEKVNAMNKNALLSNPPFLHIKSDMNFKESESTLLLYNDMFFALSSELMLSYIEYSKQRIKYNLQYQIGSEQNLYKFINENKIEYDWLEYLGLIRIDYKANNELQLI